MDSVLIRDIRTWVDNFAPDNYNASFFDSIEKQYKIKGKISEKQENAIEKIATKWNIYKKVHKYNMEHEPRIIGCDSCQGMGEIYACDDIYLPCGYCNPDDSGWGMYG